MTVRTKVSKIQAGPHSHGRDEGRPKRAAWVTPAVCLTLATCVAVVYIPAYQADFMPSWDDSTYLHNNRPLRAPDGLRQIWTTTEMPESYPNYPLTFTTFWIELQLWGLHPTGFHVTNVLLHAINAVLVFFVLRSITTPYWTAAVVAMLFALHPVQAESVAWITERKNVLSTAFYFLCFLCFRRFRAGGGPGSYGLCMLLMLCALLSKTATVTLVGSLFLADWWIDKRTPVRSLVALLPLIGLGLVFAYLTASVEHEGLSQPVAWLHRPFLAARTFWFYTATLLWPHPLLAVYPRWSGLLHSREALAFASPPPAFWFALGGFLLAAGALLLLARWVPPRTRWGLGHFFLTLLPILGFVQFGYQSHSYMADRFLYLAGFGLFLSIVELVRRALPLAPGARPTEKRLAGLSAPALTACLGIVLAVCTWQQAARWTDSLSLWSHTVRYNDNCDEGHDAIGVALSARKRYDEALPHYQRAVELVPKNAKYLTNLGNAYVRKRRFGEAIECYRKAIANRPNYDKAYYNLGNAYLVLGRIDEAISNLREALRHDPHYTKAYQGLVYAYHKTGDSRGLAWLLATCPESSIRDGKAALRIAGELVRTHPDDPEALAVLAAAQAEVGRFEQAVETAQIALKRLTGQSRALADRLNAIREHAQSRKPFRSPL